MANKEKDIVVVYFPAGGNVSLNLPNGKSFQGWWFDPRGCELTSTGFYDPDKLTFEAPISLESIPKDWVLLLKSTKEN